jgi:uncharacterized protein
MKNSFSYSLVLAFLSLKSFLVFAQPPNPCLYCVEMDAWKKNRTESLTSEDGWLNLAGLFWLEEGQNTFGSDKTNKLVFPKGAASMGQFELKNGEVFIKADPKAAVFADKTPVLDLKIFPAEKPIVLKSGALRWFVIKRGTKIGIRLRDVESPTVVGFKGIDYYDTNRKWRVKAKLEPALGDKKIMITDVLGQTNPQPSAGTLVFSISGKTYKLDAIDEGEQLFIIFKDATSGSETYGAGRFLYADKPKSGNSLMLDFNKAINPPCAFTEFATCPLPPKQNWLEVEIKAGEKKYGSHE